MSNNSFNIDYEVIQISPMEFRMMKFKYGFEEKVYTISNLNNSKWSCNCISGAIRGYCKHKDWVKLIRDGHADMLPGNVKLGKTIDVSMAKRQVMKMLTKLAKTKEGKYYEKVKKGCR